MNSSFAYPNSVYYGYYSQDCNNALTIENSLVQLVLDRKSPNDFDQLIKVSGFEFKDKYKYDKTQSIKKAVQKQINLGIVRLVQLGDYKTAPYEILVNPHYIFTGTRAAWVRAKELWLVDSQRQQEEINEVVNNQVTLLTQENGELKIEVHSLKQTVVELNQTVLELKQGNAQLRSQIAELNIRLDASHKEHLDLIAKFDKCNDWRNEALPVMTAQTARIEDLGSQVTHYSRENQALRLDIESTARKAASQFQPLPQLSESDVVSQQVEDFNKLNNAFSLQQSQLEITKLVINLGLSAAQLNKGIRTYTPFSSLEELDQENADLVLSKLKNRIGQQAA